MREKSNRRQNTHGTHSRYAQKKYIIVSRSLKTLVSFHGMKIGINRKLKLA